MQFTPPTYSQFLSAKAVAAPLTGFDIDQAEVNPLLKPHQRDMVIWACRGGRRALFSAFGIGKTVVQLEILRLMCKYARAAERADLPELQAALAVIPLGVRQEFMDNAHLLRTGESEHITDAQRAELQAWLAGGADRLLPPVKFIRAPHEAEPFIIHLTNYETVRDGKLDPRIFTVVTLDEASILRGFGGTKTFREFMRIFEGSDMFRFVATATPSPNEFIELLAYAAFLEVMDVGQAKTRFFKRDSTNADNLTLHPHKEQEFWHWVASWAIFVQKPSDLGYSDEGYELPPLNLHWHELPTDHRAAQADRDGQGRLYSDTRMGVISASREKRRSLGDRMEKTVTIVKDALFGADQAVVWCDLNDEQVALERHFELSDISTASLTGTQDIDDREDLMRSWKKGERAVFISKPMMYGAGVNLQQSHLMVFAGIGFKAQDIIQAVHREYRFLQQHPVDVHFIYTEAERDVRATLQRKWAQHNELIASMTGIIREHGLAHAGQLGMKRSMGIERREARGGECLVSGTEYRVQGTAQVPIPCTQYPVPSYILANNDAVAEAQLIESNSIGLLITSIPFSNQYEYSPNYADFGHTDDNAHFWRQMDYLVPELLRSLQPGRVAAIHVKDRITPGGVNGFGFQTVQPFSDECIQAFIKHGFAFIARKTVVTDVVRENNQTYRLGWSEQCKDGSRMGAGMPEYVLLFRKPPTDRSNGYADVPVVKEKPLCDDNGAAAPFDKDTNWKQPMPGTGYSRATWQFDAHGFTRSSGDRLLSSDELQKLPHEKLFKLWRDRSTDEVYDFKGHVGIAEDLDRMERLPATFMLFPPHSWHPDVWTDITRMRTLNSTQAAKNREMHLCPLQFDIVDRLIVQFSMEGEEVYDPFMGIGTVAHCALKLKRRARGSELSTGYWQDSIIYAKAASNPVATPTLFDALAEDAGTFFTPPDVIDALDEAPTPPSSRGSAKRSVISATEPATEAAA